MLGKLGMSCIAAALAASVQAKDINATDWIAPRLATEVSVTTGAVNDQYIVRAKVVDVGSSKLLATPVLLIAAGQPATIEIESADAVKLKMIFTVSADGKSASYTNEIQHNGEIQSSQTMVLAVRTGA